MTTEPIQKRSPDDLKVNVLKIDLRNKNTGGHLYGMPEESRTDVFCIRWRVLSVKNVMLFPFILLLSLLPSCTDNTVYHTYQAIPENFGWNKTDSLTFFFPPGLPSGAYSLEIGIRNTGRYKYRDIWLLLLQTSSDTLPPKRDTIHLYLADKKGRWNNDRGLSHYSQNTFVCDKPFVIGKDSFNRSLQIVHIMRDNPLAGISDIGVRLSRR